MVAYGQTRALPPLLNPCPGAIPYSRRSGSHDVARAGGRATSADLELELELEAPSVELESDGGV